MNAPARRFRSTAIPAFSGWSALEPVAGWGEVEAPVPRPVARIKLPMLKRLGAYETAFTTTVGDIEPREGTDLPANWLPGARNRLQTILTSQSGVGRAAITANVDDIMSVIEPVIALDKHLYGARKGLRVLVHQDVVKPDHTFHARQWHTDPQYLRTYVVRTKGHTEFLQRENPTAIVNNQSALLPDLMRRAAALTTRPAVPLPENESERIAALARATGDYWQPEDGLVVQADSTSAHRTFVPAPGTAPYISTLFRFDFT